jgi:hypothetical protein
MKEPRDRVYGGSYVDGSSMVLGVSEKLMARK